MQTKPKKAAYLEDKAPKFRTIEEELDHMRKQLNLQLAERNAFQANAQKTKKHNKELIDQLKKDNREYRKKRDELIQNKKAAVSQPFSKTATTTGFFDNRDINVWKKRYDESKDRLKDAKKVLHQLQDKLNEVTDAKYAAYEESPLTRTIRILENKLDKIMIKYNEAQSIRKTYEQIVKRLKEERIGYDNQLAAIERSLKGKEHDYVELLLLSHDAIHAKELAQTELNKFDFKKKALKTMRDKYIEGKRIAFDDKQVVNERKETNQLDFRDKNLQDKKLKQNEKINLSSEEAGIDNDSLREEINDYEEAFKKIHQVTGVTDVNEIIQKYITQDETTKSLKDLETHYQEKIDLLTHNRNLLKQELNQYKYEKAEPHSRKQLDEIELNVDNITNKCERLKIKYERLSKVLVSVKSGIEHLSEKLDFFKLEGKNNIKVTDDDKLEDAMELCVLKLKYIYNTLKNDPMFSRNDQGVEFFDQDDLLKTYMNSNLFDKGKEKRRNSEQDDDEASDIDLEDDLEPEIQIKATSKPKIDNKEKYKNKTMQKSSSKK